MFPPENGTTPDAPEMPTIEAWTDGGCSPNPGLGGWAYVLRNRHGDLKERHGAVPDTTNNKMELHAIVMALEGLSGPRHVILHTDSEYVCLGMAGRIAEWRAKGWRTAAGKPVANRDLWQRLLSATERHRVEWRWVRAHAGDPMNERADALTHQAREHHTKRWLAMA